LDTVRGKEGGSIRGKKGFPFLRSKESQEAAISRSPEINKRKRVAAGRRDIFGGEGSRERKGRREVVFLTRPSLVREGPRRARKEASRKYLPGKSYPR